MRRIGLRSAARSAARRSVRWDEALQFFKPGSKIPLQSCRTPRWSRCEIDAVAEASEFPDHLGGAPLRSLLGDRGATFLRGHAVVQELPDEAAQPMRDGTDRLSVSQADHEPAIHEFKDTACGLHCGIGGLIEQAAHLPSAARGSVAVIDARTLI